MTGTANSRCRTAGLSALILFATLAAYWPAISGTLVWDDDAYVTKSALQSLGGLRRIWFEIGATEQYYPVLHSAFWMEHRLWGDSPVGYHLANIVLHAIAAVLFGILLEHVWRRSGPAWLAAIVFALHPVAVESVAWISEQKNTLSTVFYLWALLVYLRFDRERRPLAYVFSLGLFILAVLSKSVAATLPGALLVILWWQRGRLSWRRDVAPLLPWFALGAATGLFTAWVERAYVGAEGPDFNLNFVERCLVAGHAFWFYLGKVFWPAHLMFIYPRWKVGRAWSFAFPLAAVAFLGTLWAIRRRTRGPLASALLFLGALFPTLGFLNVYAFIFSYVADHWEYLAMLAVIAPVAWGWDRLQRGFAGLRLASGAVAAGAVALLGVLTWRECRMFRDERTLYVATIERNPESWMAHNNLGRLLQLSGQSGQAETEFQAAIALQPDYAGAHYNLATIWMKTPGRLDDAIAQYEEALQLQPGYAEAHNNLGNALRSKGRLPEAATQYEEAIRLRPDDAQAHGNLGNILRAEGRYSDAVAEFEQELRLSPKDANAHYNLANALYAEGQSADAIAEYEEAARLAPDDADVRNNLGNVLNAEGRPQDAIAEYEQALRLRPDYAAIRLNLALALLQIPGRIDDAAAQVEAALRLEPGNEAARRMLAQIQASRP